MAKDKQSFVLYTDLIHTVRKMPEDKAGKLFKTILEYVNDENPEVDDIIVDLVFEPIKQQLKRDLRKWEKYIEKQKANGKKGGRPKTQKTQPFSEEPKKADNVSVSVNDNVNDINTYGFLKKNAPEEVEIFEMQNKKSIQNYEVFIENFNSKVIEEGMELDVNKLMARLRRLNANWHKDEKVKSLSLAGTMKKRYGL